MREAIRTDGSNISDTYFYLYNGHADVTALLKPDGNIVATYYYDAFGNITATGSANNNITFAGYQYDAETGLYYLNARMYDPKTARFLQEDTYLGDRNDSLSLNLYTYCLNNPLVYYDPTGHNVVSDDEAMEITEKIKAHNRKKYTNLIDKHEDLFEIFDEYTADYKSTEEYAEYMDMKSVSGTLSSIKSEIASKGFISSDDGMKLHQGILSFNNSVFEATTSDKYRTAMSLFTDKVNSSNPYDVINNGNIISKYNSFSFIERMAEGYDTNGALIKLAKIEALSGEDEITYADYYLMTTEQTRAAMDMSTYNIAMIAMGKFYYGNIGSGKGKITSSDIEASRLDALEARGYNIVTFGKNTGGNTSKYRLNTGFKGRFTLKGTSTEGAGNLGRYAKKPLNQSDFIGTLDESFVNLSTSKKIDAAFGEIESAFGKSYSNKISELYNSSSQNFIKSADDLGVFKLDVRGNPIIEINKNIGNSKVMANTILHEVRHLRQYNKLGISPKGWNALSDEFVERFATSTNLWQGKKMGLSPEDLGIFQNYYNGWRGIK